MDSQIFRNSFFGFRQSVMIFIENFFGFFNIYIVFAFNCPGKRNQPFQIIPDITCLRIKLRHLGKLLDFFSGFFFYIGRHFCFFNFFQQLSRAAFIFIAEFFLNGLKALSENSFPGSLFESFLGFGTDFFLKLQYF